MSSSSSGLAFPKPASIAAWTARPAGVTARSPALISNLAAVLGIVSVDEVVDAIPAVL